MKRTSILQNGFLVLVALALVGLLAFLYDKTQAADIRGQSEALSRLREIKEIDTRWDFDIQRSGTDRDSTFGPPGINIVDRRASLDGALRRLADTARDASSKALTASLFEISLAMRQKAQLVDNFRQSNVGARAALDMLEREARVLSTMAADIKPPVATIDAGINRLLVNAPLYYWHQGTTVQGELETALNDLQQGTPSLPEWAQAKSLLVRDATQALIKHKQAEQKLTAQIAVLPTSARINNLTQSLDRELDASLQGKEVYRVYLIAYAAALLIALGWLVAKLRAANVSLEKRVEQRTTELSDALQHLKESESQLIQSEKMSSLGQMVAGVAHEINTPLAYVKNSLSTVAGKLPEIDTALKESDHLLVMLEAGADADPDKLSSQYALVSQQLSRLKQQDVVKELTTLVKDGIYGTTQMAEIVGNLKDFSRLDRSKVTSFNLNDGLSSTLLLAKHLLKTVTVEKKFSAIPPVICSPSQVNQVFLNLVTNAAQAFDGLATAGKITLITRAVNGAEGQGVVVEVIDNGKGIAPDVLPKIFDPFFSTKEIGKGTGLGLSISYKIVEQHGGKISVDSTVGKGTRFQVFLPSAPPAESAQG